MGWILRSKARTISKLYLRCQIYPFLVNIYLYMGVVSHNWFVWLHSDAYWKPSLSNKMKLFGKIVNSFQPLTILSKSFILDVWLGSECACGIYKVDFLLSNCKDFDFWLKDILFNDKIVKTSFFWGTKIISTNQAIFRNLPVQSFRFKRKKRVILECYNQMNSHV